MLKNIKSALKNSVIYGIGSMLPKLVGFVLLPIITTRFNKSEYGLISMLESAQFLFLALFGLAFYQALFRWYCDKKYVDKQKEIFFTSLVFMGIVALAMFGILAPFAKQVSYLFLNTDKNYQLIYFVLITTAFELFVQIVTSVIRLQEKPMLFTVGNMLRFFTSFVLTIWFIYFKKMWIEGIYYAQFAGMFVFTVYISKYVWRNIKIKFEWGILKEMLHFCYPLAFSAVFAVILTNTDRFALKSTTSFSEVGLYTLGSKIANAIFLLIVTPINMAIAPMVFKMIDDPNNKRFYSKLLTYFCFGISLIVLGMSLFGKEIIKVYSHNPEYWDAYKFVPILSFAILMNSLKDNSVIGLQISKKTSILATIIGIMALFTILCNKVLIPIMGSQGAAVSVLFTSTAYFLTVLYHSQKHYYIPYEIKKIVISILVCAALCASAILVNGSNIIIRMIAKTLIWISFPIILYWFNFYEPIELETMGKIWAKWKNPLTWPSNMKQVKI